MNTKLITSIIMVAVIAVLIIWDVYVAANPVPGDTISEITLNFARRHPVIPFALGFVCGHLFWPQSGG
jgi:hypothetical protein